MDAGMDRIEARGMDVEYAGLKGSIKTRDQIRWSDGTMQVYKLALLSRLAGFGNLT